MHDSGVEGCGEVGKIRQGVGVTVDGVKQVSVSQPRVIRVIRVIGVIEVIRVILAVLGLIEPKR